MYVYHTEIKGCHACRIATICNSEALVGRITGKLYLSPLHGKCLRESLRISQNHHYLSN